MEIKDQNVETAIDSEGHEYISEIDATLTETSADGTESVAEMTLTADPDDPTDVEGHMTVTETETDGTETVTEYVANDEGVFKVEEESALENAVEEIFGVEIGDDLTQVMDANGNPVNEDAGDGEVFQAEPDVQTEDTDFTESDFTVGDEMYDPSFTPTETTETFEPEETSDSTFDGGTDMAYSAQSFDNSTAYSAESPDDSTFDSTLGTTDSADTAFSETSETDAAEAAEQEAHTQAATDAQSAADEFIASGDYSAAAEARETAENEAWEAGDNSMLSAYDAQDLTTAAENQENAEYYEAREAEHAQAGDYEAAKEDAGNAAYAVGNADYYAGGDDHTGQAKAEEYNMDNAIWQEGIAEDDLNNAAYYAEAGNYDAADAALDSAAEHQDMADNYGDLGEHGGDTAYYDPSSEVESGGSYDSTYDSHIADMDTGYDAGVDTSYDAGVTTSYDSGSDDY